MKKYNHILKFETTSIPTPNHRTNSRSYKNPFQQYSYICQPRKKGIYRLLTYAVGTSFILALPLWIYNVRQIARYKFTTAKPKWISIRICPAINDLISGNITEKKNYLILILYRMKNARIKNYFERTSTENNGYIRRRQDS